MYQPPVELTPEQGNEELAKRDELYLVCINITKPVMSMVREDRWRLPTEDNLQCYDLSMMGNTPFNSMNLISEAFSRRVKEGDFADAFAFSRANESPANTEGRFLIHTQITHNGIKPKYIFDNETRTRILDFDKMDLETLAEYVYIYDEDPNAERIDYLRDEIKTRTKAQQILERLVPQQLMEDMQRNGRIGDNLLTPIDEFNKNIEELTRHTENKNVTRFRHQNRQTYILQKDQLHSAFYGVPVFSQIEEHYGYLSQWYPLIVTYTDPTTKENKRYGTMMKYSYDKKNDIESYFFYPPKILLNAIKSYELETNP